MSDDKAVPPAPPEKESSSWSSPLLMLASIAAAWLLHTSSSGSLPGSGPRAAAAGPVPEFTLEEMSWYNGKNGDPTLALAIWGRVFNVTAGKEFYGEGETYNLFAGNDCTRAMALTSTKKKELNKDIKGLKADKIKQVNTSYWETYIDKYPIIGRLVDPPYNPADYDKFAGPISEMKVTGMKKTSGKKKQKQSNCPMKIAARVLAKTVANLIPLQLAAPSWFGGGEEEDADASDEPEVDEGPEVEDA